LKVNNIYLMDATLTGQLFHETHLNGSELPTFRVQLKSIGASPYAFPRSKHFRNRSFIRYAVWQGSAYAASGLALSLGLAIALAQWGGIRWGRDQAPSRSFLSAMRMACRG
jgi:hypothetical protein